MKYFLQNIAQSSPMRTILLVLIGLVFWVVSIIGQEHIVSISSTLALTSLNSLLFALFFYKSGITKFLSPFVGASYWTSMSAVPILHSCWQTQLVALVGIVIALILSSAKHKDNVTEEAFLSTFVCCFVLPTRITMLVCMGILWIYLIVKGWMTWRVLAACIIAIILRVILMIVLHYFNWLEWLWLENIPTLSWLDWTIAGGVSVGILVTTLLPIRRASVASGSIYTLFLLALLVAGILFSV